MLDFKTKFLKQKFTAPCRKVLNSASSLLNSTFWQYLEFLLEGRLQTNSEKNIDVKTEDRVMEKWRRKGSILNQNKGNSGPKRSVRTDENISSVKARIQKSSQSVRKIEAELGINRESVRIILKKDLGLKSYKFQTSQQLSLSAGDRERRLEFCNRMKRILNNGK